MQTFKKPLYTWGVFSPRHAITSMTTHQRGTVLFHPFLMQLSWFSLENLAKVPIYKAGALWARKATSGGEVGSYQSVIDYLADTIDDGQRGGAEQQGSPRLKIQRGEGHC
jgi:hypothetical protein